VGKPATSCHIDEAMSWETVRNLDRMPKLLLVIRNLCGSGGAPAEVIENIEDVEEILIQVQDAIHQGETF
jgi:carbamoylphosphate synthase large subunit